MTEPQPTTPNWNMTGVPFPAVCVRWGPNDELGPGVRIFRIVDEDEHLIGFIPWSVYEDELNRRLLPQLFADPTGYKFAVLDYHGKKNWLVRIRDASDQDYCAVWFGGDPDHGWIVDGLVRVGDANSEPHTWQAYQRHADGSYRCVYSLCGSLDEMRRSRVGDH